MTAKEFLLKYNDYVTTDLSQAVNDSIKINEILIDAKCVPIKMGDQYHLMLNTATAFLHENNILE